MAGSILAGSVAISVAVAAVCGCGDYQGTDLIQVGDLVHIKYPGHTIRP